MMINKKIKNLYELLKNNFDEKSLKKFYNDNKITNLTENEFELNKYMQKVNEKINKNFLSAVSASSGKLLSFFKEIKKDKQIPYEKLTKYMAVGLALENIKEKNIIEKTKTATIDFINDAKKEKENIKSIILLFFRNRMKTTISMFTKFFIKKESLNLLESKGWQPPYVHPDQYAVADKIIITIKYIIWLIVLIIKNLIYILYMII